MPYELSQVVGAALPFVEIALGVLLLLGVATRLAAGVSAGPAGDLHRRHRLRLGPRTRHRLRMLRHRWGTPAGEEPSYALDIARDVGFLLLAGFLVVWPRTRWSVDSVINGGEESDE